MRKGQSLEDAFFYEQDRRLLESLREMKTLEETTGLLAEVSGLRDPRVLLRLAELQVTPSAAASLAIFPLVAVAWADESVDALERETLTAVLEDTFFFPTIVGQILEAWLAFRPPAALFENWEAYARDLSFQLGPVERETLAKEILGHARKMAEATGGFLGLGDISESEHAVLDRLGRALLHA